MSRSPRSARTAPVFVLAAVVASGVALSLALVALWRRGGLPRLVAAGLSATLLFWSAQAALRYYAASFFVAGR